MKPRAGYCGKPALTPRGPTPPAAKETPSFFFAIGAGEAVTLFDSGGMRLPKRGGRPSCDVRTLGVALGGIVYYSIVNEQEAGARARGGERRRREGGKEREEGK